MYWTLQSNIERQFLNSYHCKYFLFQLCFSAPLYLWSPSIWRVGWVAGSFGISQGIFKAACFARGSTQARKGSWEEAFWREWFSNKKNASRKGEFEICYLLTSLLRQAAQKVFLSFDFNGAEHLKWSRLDFPFVWKHFERAFQSEINTAMFTCSEWKVPSWRHLQSCDVSNLYAGTMPFLPFSQQISVLQIFPVKLSYKHYNDWVEVDRTKHIDVSTTCYCGRKHWGW